MILGLKSPNRGLMNDFVANSKLTHDNNIFLMFSPLLFGVI